MAQPDPGSPVNSNISTGSVLQLPVAQRVTDVTIYGATGFTGQHVVAEALKSLPPNITITIAGRSKTKLAALAARFKAPAGRLRVLGGVDSSDVAALTAMAQQTRLLLNCAGPFRLLGDAVFAAAAAAGTDYLDICGEPEFIEAAAHRHGAAAAASGALMASAAGFDSIPADVGCLFTSQAFPRLFGPAARPAAVEAVIRLDAPLGTSIHFATWEAAVLGISSVNSLHRLRRQAAAAGTSDPRPKLLGRRPAAPEGPVWDKRLSAYTLPFPGADASIVRRTQAALAAAGEPAVHFGARFSLPSLLLAMRFVGYGGLMMAMCKSGWGRRLLLKWPGLFSHGLVTHEGPSRSQMEATTTTLDFFASGFSTPPPEGTAAAAAVPDLRVHTRVVLGDPGYLATSAMLIAAAATMLQERDSLLQAAGRRGGVFTVGTLFRCSNLMQRLEGAGVTFRIVDSSSSSSGGGDACADSSTIGSGV